MWLLEAATSFAARHGVIAGLRQLLPLLRILLLEWQHWQLLLQQLHTDCFASKHVVEALACSTGQGNSAAAPRARCQMPSNGSNTALLHMFAFRGP